MRLHRLQTEFLRGTDDPYGDFPSIGNEKRLN
jgi:hypothetical protein